MMDHRHAKRWFGLGAQPFQNGLDSLDLRRAEAPTGDEGLGGNRGRDPNQGERSTAPEIGEIALRAYRFGLYVGEPAVAGLLAWRSRQGKEDPGRLPERRGLAGRARPSGSLVWMHGASVGEALSLVGLVDGMIARGFSVLVTTGTRSAAELIGRRLPAGAVHQYMPLDAPRWIERFLDHWHPDLAPVAESEIWPNTVIALHRRCH